MTLIALGRTCAVQRRVFRDMVHGKSAHNEKVSSDFAEAFLAQARHSLLHYHLPRITRCLNLLSPEQIGWRPHPTSNSVGNLALHLSGNVRQWIISGLGGAPDRRQRDQEFAARGPMPRAALLKRLGATVTEACRALHRLRPADLARPHSIQGFRVSGFEAVHHVVEHFAYHTGQIIFATKLLRGEDLGFTRLPGEKKHRAQGLPSL